MMAVTVPFEAHAEVWTLVAGVLALGWYTAKVVQPKAVAAGYHPITRGQKTWFVLALLSMWIVSDWPVHEIAEQYLYFVHMFQHLFLSMLIPGMFVLATPRWLFELVLRPGTRAWQLLRNGSKPLFAGLAFNGLTLLMHWSALVQLSSDNGAVHFGLHLVIFCSGLLMWMPIIGPVPEWRISPLAQCFYLFAMSIVPTVPSGWLVFAEEVVYRHYDTPERLWGVDVLTDQQAAGVVMKLVGGFALWIIIFIVFTRWATKELSKDERERTERQRAAREALTAKNANDDGTIAGDPTEVATNTASAAGSSIDLSADAALDTPPGGLGVLTFEQVQDEFDKNPAPGDDR